MRTRLKLLGLQIRAVALVGLIVLCYPFTSSAQKLSEIFSGSSANMDRLVEIKDFNEEVVCINEDDSGNIWFGTNSGVYKYDGQRFKRYYYNYDSTSGLRSNIIGTIFKSPSAGLWVGQSTYNISKYNSETDDFTSYPINVDLAKFPSRPYHITSLNNSSDLLCAMDRTFGIFSTEKEEFTYLINDQDSKEYSSIGFVRFIEEDPLDSDVWWIGTINGLYKYGVSDTSFSRIEIPNRSSTNIVQAFDFDEMGNLYFASTTGLVCSVHKNRLTADVVASLQPREDKNLTFPCLVKYQDGELLIGYRMGNSFLVQLDNTESDVKVTTIEAAPGGIITFFKDQRGLVWVGRRDGVMVYNPDYTMSKKYELSEYIDIASYVYDIDQYSKDSPFYVSMAQNDGLIEMNVDGTTAKKYKPRNTPESKKFIVKGVSFDEEGLLWLTSNSGLYTFNCVSKSFDKILGLEDFSVAKSIGILQFRNDEEIVMQGYNPYSIIKYNIGTKAMSEFALVGDDDECRVSVLRQCRNFDVTDDGVVWIAGRPHILQLKDDCVRSLQLPESLGIEVLGSKCIDINRAGEIYLAYSTKGVVKMTPTADGYTYSTNTSANGLFSDKVIKVESDHQDNLWLATAAGVLFSRNNEGFHKVALPLVPDEDYFLSLRTLKTLHSGDVAMGRKHTFFKFDSEVASKKLVWKKPIFQRIQLTDAPDILLDSSAQVLLPFNHGALSFLITDQVYGRATTPSYKYRLIGQSVSAWQSTIQSVVRFYDLPPGDYKLEVAPNSNGEVMQDKIAQLDFTVLSPWYRTTLAWIVWTLLSLGFLYLLFSFLLNRKLIDQKLSHAVSLREMQVKLFTNITHELRTPLTIIGGNAKQINKDNYTEKKQSILRNTKVLKNYVDELLDLSTIDADRYSLNKVQADAVYQAGVCVEMFKSLSDTKGVSTHLLSSDNEIWMDVDLPSYKKILNNLIHNAIKFTPNGGNIYVDLSRSDEELSIKVVDTGEGIKKEHLPHIFDRYYKTFDLEENLGSGIGMALTKELVQLLEGDISVQSQRGKGTTFIIKLPISQNAPLGARIYDDPEDISQMGKSPLTQVRNQDTSRPCVLVAEDNPELNHYLTELFTDRYQVVSCPDGEQALAACLESPPDLIVSDIMMPRMNGYELCQGVKSDWKLCHIPVILLTARADKDSKMAGYEEGADAYLQKPFDDDELLAIAQSLIKNRQRITRAEPQIPDQEFSSDFHKTVHDIVCEHLSEEILSVEYLAGLLGMSRTSLYRDMKEKMEVAPSRYIRELKMKAAIDLLESTDDRINEIAYKTGFSDPSYFTRIFHQETGMSPIDFRQRRKDPKIDL